MRPSSIRIRSWQNTDHLDNLQKSTNFGLIVLSSERKQQTKTVVFPPREGRQMEVGEMIALLVILTIGLGVAVDCLTERGRSQ